MGRGRTNNQASGASAAPRGTASGHWDEIVRKRPHPSPPVSSDPALPDTRDYLWDRMLAQVHRLTMGTPPAGKITAQARLTDLLVRDLRLEYPDLNPMRGLLAFAQPLTGRDLTGVQASIFASVPRTLDALRGQSDDSITHELTCQAHKLLVSAGMRQMTERMTACELPDLHGELSLQLSLPAMKKLAFKGRELGYGGLEDMFDALTTADRRRLYSGMVADPAWMVPALSETDRRLPTRFRRAFARALAELADDGTIRSLRG